MDELFTQLKELFYFLQQNDNEKLQIATESLGLFYSQPESVHVLICLFQKSLDEPIIRHHAVIGLLSSIKQNWCKFDFDSQLKIFRDLLNLIIHENVFAIRNNLIDAVQFSMEDKLIPHLFQFIVQASETGNDIHLEMSLLLCPLVIGKSEEINNFCVSLIGKGYNSNLIDVKIATLNLALYYPPFIRYQGFSDNLGYYFYKATELLYECFNNITQLNRLKRLFNFLIRADFNCIEYLSDVLYKCLGFFEKIDVKNLESLLMIFEIVQTFCSSFPNNVLEWGHFDKIIRISFQLCSLLFNTNDSFDLSNAGFFESVISDLCKTIDLIDKLYNFFYEIQDSEPGKFFILCCLDVTLSIFPDYYVDKIKQITEFLYYGLTCSSRLLRDSAIITTNSFIKYYGNETDSVARLVNGVYISLNNDCYPELLYVLSSLLEQINNTDYFFDSFFEFLLNLIINESSEIKSAALISLASLASSSLEQIKIHFNEFYQIISEILYSQKFPNSELKAQSVICLSKASTNLGDFFKPFLLDFCNFCIFSIKNSDDSYLVNSCFGALETITQKYPNSIYSVQEEILSIVCKYAAIDFDSEYRAYIANSIDSLNSDLFDEIMFDNVDSISKFIQISFALRILSILVKNNIEDLVHTYTIHIINCCDLHKNSVSNICKSAVAYAIGNLSQALVNHHYGSFNTIPDQMGNIILQLLNGNINDDNNLGLFTDAFDAATKIVEWLDHDSLTTSIGPLLQFCYNFLSNALKLKNRRKIINVINNICSFLNMIIASAEERSIELLHDFFPLFIKCIEIPSSYLNSISISFFSSLIVVASEQLDNEFKINILNYALKFANEGNDCNSFSYIRELIIKDKDICTKYANDIYILCTSKLKFLPVTKSQDFLLMKDSCVITFIVLIMNIGVEFFNLDKILPLILSSLPLIDISNNYIVSDFFKTLEEKYNIELDNL